MSVFVSFLVPLRVCLLINESLSIVFFTTVSKKKGKESTRLELEHAAILSLIGGKFAKEKLKLLTARKKSSLTTLKWKNKLDKLHEELDMASDSTYNKKKKTWNTISEQIEKAQAKENKMKD